MNIFKPLLPKRSNFRPLTAFSRNTAEKARSKATTENGISRELTDKEFLVKLHAEAHVDELAEVSLKHRRPPVPDGKNHSFAKDGFTYRTAYFQDFDGSYYKITLSIGHNGNVATVYNVGKIKADDIPDGKIISTIGSKADMSSTKYSISNATENVNTDFSLSTPTEDIAPVGNFNIHGWDISDFDAPIRDDINVGGQLPGMRESAESGIRDQLRSSQDALNEMGTVADIYVPEEYRLLDVAGKKNWVVDKLHQTGYKVDRKGLGVIEFARKQLKSAFNYFKKGSVEETAFEALPAVLENGIEISARTQHKGRDYGTVTIAAPITINGKRGNMAVVVKQTTGNYYKVHRILTPDGSEFILPETTNEAESTPAGESPINGSLATPKDSASEDIIIDGREDVNTEVTSDEDVSENIRIKIQNLQTEMDNNQRLREESSADYDGEIARLQAEYEVWRPNGDPSYKTVAKLLPRYETSNLKSRCDSTSFHTLQNGIKRQKCHW